MTHQSTADQRELQRKMARKLVAEEVRYIFICHNCGNAEARKRDSSVVEEVRSGKGVCGDCGGEWDLIRDDKPSTGVKPKADGESKDPNPDLGKLADDEMTQTDKGTKNSTTDLSKLLEDYE